MILNSLSVTIATGAELLVHTSSKWSAWKYRLCLYMKSSQFQSILRLLLSAKTDGPPKTFKKIDHCITFLLKYLHVELI